MMKKRVWILALAAVMILSMAACGSTSSGGGDKAADASSGAGAETAGEESAGPAPDSDEYLYRDVLDHYYDQAVKGWPSPDFEGEEISYLFYEYPYLPQAGVRDIGYAFADIDKDGQKELIVNRLAAEEDPSVIYDLFTLVGGKPVHLASSGERYRYRLCEDGSITYYGSGGASDNYQMHYTLRDGKMWMLEFIHATDQFFGGVYVPYYGKDLSEEEYQQYVKEGREEDYIHEHMKAISQPEADRIAESWPAPKEIALTPLSSYRGEAEQQAETEEKAGTYEAVKADVTWTTARDSAEAMGGILTCVNNSREFEKVCAAADEAGLKGFWVGAFRDENEDWYDSAWLDGDDLDRSMPWYDGEPSYKEAKSGKTECCLMVFKVKGKWYFNDAADNVLSVAPNYAGKMGYVVEY